MSLPLRGQNSKGYLANFFSSYFIFQKVIVKVQSDEMADHIEDFFKDISTSTIYADPGQPAN